MFNLITSNSLIQKTHKYSFLIQVNKDLYSLINNSPKNIILILKLTVLSSHIDINE